MNPQPLTERTTMSNYEHDSFKISTSTCDDCGRKGPGTEYFSHGASVYFTCKHCEPKHFERTARRDIDTWLNGGA